MKNILLTGIACLATFIADGRVASGSLTLDDQNSVGNPCSTINRLDMLAGKTDPGPIEHPDAPPIMEESSVPIRPVPSDPMKKPPFTPDITNFAVITRTGNEIMHVERHVIWKPANTEPSLNGSPSNRSMWNYRRTLESWRF